MISPETFLLILLNKYQNIIPRSVSLTSTPFTPAKTQEERKKSAVVLFTPISNLKLPALYFCVYPNCGPEILKDTHKLFRNQV